MDVKEVKEKLKSYDLSQLDVIPHARKRAKEKKRQISYPLIIKHLINPESLYKVVESVKHKERYELYFKLSERMNLMVVVEFKKNLNIITAYKTDKWVNERIRKEAEKYGRYKGSI